MEEADFLDFPVSQALLVSRVNKVIQVVQLAFLALVGSQVLLVLLVYQAILEEQQVFLASLV